MQEVGVKKKANKKKMEQDAVKEPESSKKPVGKIKPYWFFWGETKIDKTGEEHFYPYLGISKSVKLDFTPKEDDVSLREFFEYVRKELKKVPGHPYKLEVDLNPQDFSSFQKRKKNFQKTKNPVYAIRAFIEAHNYGIYPPEWAIDFITNALKKFDTSNGKEELNKVLGFKKSKGQDPAYKEYLSEQRDLMLCHDVFYLTAYFDMSIDDACTIVANRLEDTSDYEVGIKLKKISEETIRDKYFKKSGKEFKNSSYHQNKASKATKEDIIRFIKKFSGEFLDSYKDIYPALKAYL